MKKTILIFIFFLLLVSQAFAVTRYGSTTGIAAWGECTSECSGDETQCCSVATVNSSASDGDIVYFMNGTYTARLDPANSGTSTSSYITFKALNEHSAIFDYSTEDTHSVRINGKDFIRLEDLAVVANYKAVATWGAGVQINSGANGYYLKNLKVYGDQDEKIIGVYAADGGSGAKIEDCEIYNLRVGIELTSATGFVTLVTGNFIHDLIYGDSTGADGIRVTGAGDFSGTLIEKNEIMEWSGDCIDFYGSDGATAQYNYCHDPIVGGEGGPKNGIKLGSSDSTGTKALFNYIENLNVGGTGATQYGITTNGADNCVIQGNIIDVADGGGIAIDGSTGGTVVLNNSTNDCDTAIWAGSSSTATAQNNILDKGSGGTGDFIVTSGSTITGGYNIFKNDAAAGGAGSYTNTDSADQYQVDPKYNSPASNEFWLQADSPCIDKGKAIAGYNTKLLSPSSWPNSVLTGPVGNGQDIGAYEFPVWGE
jgi:hypothetical protein